MPGKICQAAAADRELPYHGSDRSISGNPLCCDWNCTPIENTGASGERYRDAQFIRENNILTIGVEDENPVFDTERYPDGMGYILRERVESVTFGVAWADDYTDGDVRTWLAADPG